MIDLSILVRLLPTDMEMGDQILLTVLWHEAQGRSQAKGNHGIFFSTTIQ